MNTGALALVVVAFRVVQLLVLARVVISWVPVNRYHPAVRFINDVTEPLLRPFRAVARTAAGGIDFSPLILLVVLYVAERIIVGLLSGGK